MNFGTQLLLTVGVVLIFGLLISALRKIFCRVAGRVGYWVLLVSGLVGTPVHELSHALMCVIFGHRIDEVKLYDPGNPDGTLGYVRHSYNRRNIYHNVGHFFIGTAPIICGGLVLLLLMRWMVPDVYAAAAPGMGGSFTMAGLDLGVVLSDYAVALKNTAAAILAPENLSVGRWWIFIIVSVMIAGHMELSLSDVTSGIMGFLIISVLLFVADLITWLINPSALMRFTEAVGGYSMYVAGFLGLAVIFLTLLVAVAAVIRFVLMLFGARR